MAHFAELDSKNLVIRVVVIDDKETCDANGDEKEHIGAAFCEKLFGGTWKKTSYNHNIRKRFAGIGYTYDKSLDAFIPPKPYKSWKLNKTTADWDPPVPLPDDASYEKRYSWNEDDKTWDPINSGA